MTQNDGTEQDLTPAVAEGFARKARTEARLAEDHIPTLAWLPRISSADETRLRMPTEVAQRAFALFVTAMRADVILSEHEMSVAELRERCPQGFAALSPREQEFFAASEPTKQMLIDSLWRYESLAVLQWALGWLDTLNWPTEICDLEAVIPLMAVDDSEADKRIRMAALRPVDELLDAQDLYLRLHWATRQASLTDQPMPAGLNNSVVMERHYALNWLTTFLDQDWDNVDTPT